MVDQNSIKFQAENYYNLSLLQTWRGKLSAFFVLLSLPVVVGNLFLLRYGKSLNLEGYLGCIFILLAIAMYNYGSKWLTIITVCLVSCVFAYVCLTFTQAKDFMTLILSRSVIKTTLLYLFLLFALGVNFCIEKQKIQK